MPSRLKQSLYYLLSALRTPLLPETPSTPPTQVPEVLEGNSGLEVTWSVGQLLPAPAVSSDVDRDSGLAQVQNVWWWRGWGVRGLRLVVLGSFRFSPGPALLLAVQAKPRSGQQGARAARRSRSAWDSGVDLFQELAGLPCEARPHRKYEIT